MMEQFFYLKAGPHALLPMNREVISSNTSEYYLSVHVPEEICRAFKLYQVDEIDEVSKDAQLVEFEFIKYENGHPWFDIVFAALNQEPGYHTYRMKFVNPTTDATTSVYFGYIIQDTNPDRPYIYVDREEDNCV